MSLLGCSPWNLLKRCLHSEICLSVVFDLRRQWRDLLFQLPFVLWFDQVHLPPFDTISQRYHRPINTMSFQSQYLSSFQHLMMKCCRFRFVSEVVYLVLALQFLCWKLFDDSFDVTVTLGDEYLQFERVAWSQIVASSTILCSNKTIDCSLRSTPSRLRISIVHPDRQEMILIRTIGKKVDRTKRSSKICHEIFPTFPRLISSWSMLDWRFGRYLWLRW